MQMAHAAPNISRSIRDRYGVVRYGMVWYHTIWYHTTPTYFMRLRGMWTFTSPAAHDSQVLALITRTAATRAEVLYMPSVVDLSAEHTSAAWPRSVQLHC